MSDHVTTTSPDEVRDAVRERYAAAARSQMAAADDAACGCGTGCCGAAQVADPISADLYDPTDVPSEGALAASLGCGNPTALAELHAGDDVLDLGSGGGLDVLLSARRVAPGGTAFGVDMTPEMLELAERNKAEAGIGNAEFLLGSIEDLPLPDDAVDVVISNCVVNLSTDKDAVLREAFRVLRPGGRFAVSDIVLLRPLPAELMGLVALWTGCISGALVDADYVKRLTTTGFVDASVEVTRSFRRDELEDLAAELTAGALPPGLDLAEAVDALDGAFASAFIRASKPR